MGTARDKKMRTSDHLFRALVVSVAAMTFFLSAAPDANWPHRHLPPTEALWSTLTTVMIVGGLFLAMFSRDPRFSFLSGVISVAGVVAMMMLATATQVFPAHNVTFVIVALLVAWISSTGAAVAAERIDSYFWRGAWEALLPVAAFVGTAAAQQERWLLAGVSVALLIGFQFFWSPWKKAVEQTAFHS